MILLFRHAKSPGHFLGQTWIGEKDSRRPLFLPNDELKSTCSIFDLRSPQPGVFIYQFSASFNYPNASHFTEAMVKYILQHTRRTKEKAYAKKGDNPWNDPDHSHKDADAELPLLRAIILDFGAVSSVDVTSIQNLIDVRNQLNHRAAPLKVQWHFAGVRNRWTRRALAAAGFGCPSTAASTVIDGKPVGSLNSHPHGDPVDVEKGKEISDKCEEWVEPFQRDGGNGAPTGNDLTGRSYFHVDLTSALESVNAHLAPGLVN